MQQPTSNTPAKQKLATALNGQLDTVTAPPTSWAQLAKKPAQQATIVKQALTTTPQPQPAKTPLHQKPVKVTYAARGHYGDAKWANNKMKKPIPTNDTELMAVVRNDWAHFYEDDGENGLEYTFEYGQVPTKNTTVRRWMIIVVETDDARLVTHYGPTGAG